MARTQVLDTAERRLHIDRSRWLRLCWLTVILLIMVAAKRFHSPLGEAESTALSLTIAVVAFFVILLTVRAAQRYRPRGRRADDKWQAQQGNLVDLVLSGACFQSFDSGALAGGTAGAGLNVIQAGGTVANLPALGGLGGPFAIAGLAVVAASAVFGLAGAATQKRRNKAATKAARASAEALLAKALRDLEQTFGSLAGAEKNQAERDIGRTRRAISKIHELQQAG